MYSTHCTMFMALSAGAGARVAPPTIERTWYFIDKFNGERPVGAPPG